jgi:hypothetical protein
VDIGLEIRKTNLDHENIEIHTFQKNKDRFFDELVSLVTALSNFDLAIEVHANEGHSVNAMKKDHSVYLYGRTVTYAWNPHDTLAALRNDIWPNTLTLAKLAPDITRTKGSIELSVGGISSFIHSICGLTYMRYYESIKPLIIKKYGQDPNLWPKTLNFSRVVRNSIAHGGKINIKNKNAVPVEWKGITISQADNDELLFQPQKYIGVGDLVLLIEDSENDLV